MVDVTNPLSLVMPEPLPKGKGKGKGGLDVNAVMAPIVSPIGGASTGPSYADTLQVTRDAAEARKRVEDNTSFINDIVPAAFLSQTMTGTGARAAAMNSYRADLIPDPTFVVPKDALANKTVAEQEELLGAVNNEHLFAIQQEQAEHGRLMEITSRHGITQAILGGLVAGLPEGYLMGVGTAKAMAGAGLGAARLAAQGRRGAAIAAGFGEQVGGNVAGVALQSTWDTHVGPQDYVMAAATGAVFGALEIPGVAHHGESTRLADTLRKLHDDAAEVQFKRMEQAQKNLGEGATPAQIKAETIRLESEALHTVTHTGGTVPEERKLFGEDAPREDAPLAEAHNISESDNGVNAAQASRDAPAGDFKTLPEAIQGTRDAVSPETGGSTIDQPFKNEFSLADRVKRANTDPGWMEAIRQASGGAFGDEKSTRALAPGLHVTRSAADPKLGHSIQLIRDVQHMLPADHKIVLGVENRAGTARGRILSANKTHFISITKGFLDSATPADVARTVSHEMGHAIYHAHASKMPADISAKVDKYLLEYINLHRVGSSDASAMRFSPTSVNAQVRQPKRTPYIYSTDEMFAEQFVKWLEHQATLPGSTLKLTEHIKKAIVDAIEAVRRLFDSARYKQLRKPGEGFFEFFTMAHNGEFHGQMPWDVQPEVKSSMDAADTSVNQQGASNVRAVSSDPVAVYHGLHLLPMDTATQQAEAAAILSLFKKAEATPKADPTRLSKLLDTAMFKGGQSMANTMLRSENPIMRLVANELLENPSGAGGRQSSASLAKHLKERQYMGNVINEYQDAYTVHRKQAGATVIDDVYDGKERAQFDKLVAREVESRRKGAVPVESSDAVKRGADALERVYEKMRLDQVETKTVGWASMPETSVGYMPHRMSTEKVMNMTTDQRAALHAAMTDQFIRIEGWDPSFADKIASRYIDVVHRRAMGGFDTPIGAHQVGAADVVQEALEHMGLGKDEVRAMMTKYMAGAASHTKKRIRLDLNEPIKNADGSTWTLMDIMDTNHMNLVRSQVQRVSGEVALAKHGVMGKSHLKLLREAMTQGHVDAQVNMQAKAHELRAYDQMVAEFLGEPFGTQNKNVGRVMLANSVIRLGGMGFTQMAETVNGFVAVGVGRTLAGVASFGRLHSEIKALARGEKVNNTLLKSLEDFGGAEFGTDSYKIVFPFDNGSLEHQTYGSETTTLGDRLLRGASHVQGKLSMWRSIHAVQQRGFAEQIVRKSFEYLQSGKNDAALKDMGISDALMGKLRNEINTIASFDGNRVTGIDITKMEDKLAADEYVQAIHRGVSQIIQETFIGEKGAWVHNDVARLMTQFRTFSITSIEKQWNRQRGNYGTAATMGILMGAMSVAAPIYMMRTYLGSIGRGDQAAYLDRQLDWKVIARQTLNYVAASGLAGDFIDVGDAVLDTGLGGRAGKDKDAFGNFVAPAVGLGNDIFKAIQNTRDGTDIHGAMKLLPGNRLPWLVPAINALGD